MEATHEPQTAAYARDAERVRTSLHVLASIKPFDRVYETRHGELYAAGKGAGLYHLAFGEGRHTTLERVNNVINGVRSYVHSLNADDVEAAAKGIRNLEASFSTGHDVGMIVGKVYVAEQALLDIASSMRQQQESQRQRQKQQEQDQQQCAPDHDQKKSVNVNMQSETECELDDTKLECKGGARASAVAADKHVHHDEEEEDKQGQEEEEEEEEGEHEEAEEEADLEHIDGEGDDERHSSVNTAAAGDAECVSYTYGSSCTSCAKNGLVSRHVQGAAQAVKNEEEHAASVYEPACVRVAYPRLLFSEDFSESVVIAANETLSQIPRTGPAYSITDTTHSSSAIVRDAAVALDWCVSKKKTRRSKKQHRRLAQ